MTQTFRTIIYNGYGINLLPVGQPENVAERILSALVQMSSVYQLRCLSFVCFEETERVLEVWSAQRRALIECHQKQGDERLKNGMQSSHNYI